MGADELKGLLQETSTPDLQASERRQPPAPVGSKAWIGKSFGLRNQVEVPFLGMGKARKRFGEQVKS